MKAKRIMPILLSAMMTLGIATAASFSANAVESVDISADSSQTENLNLATPKITKAESVYGGVKLDWNKVDGAKLYRVYYKGKKGWTRMTDTTATSYLDADVLSGKNYTYTVRCVSENGKQFASGYDSKGTKATYIAAPEISKAESINSGVKLSWNKVDGAEKYRVYYKGNNGWTRTLDTTSTSYIDRNVSSGKSYTYTVRCISSDAKKFTSGFNPNGASVTYTATPEITNLENVNGGVKITWNSVNGAEIYRVYYKGRNGWTRMVDTTSTSYIDKDVLSGNNFTYTVRCITSDGKHFASGYNTAGKAIKYIATPEISKTEVTYNSVKLSWNKVKGAERYRIYLKGSNGWKKLGDTTSTSFTHKNVSADKDYTYTVRCLSADGKKFASGYNSKGVTVKTDPMPPIILEKTSLTLDKGKSYTLKKTVTDESKPISWSSSNTKVATVNSNGKITAVGKGSAVITAEYDGFKASCNVTVKVKKIYLSPSNQNANTYATGGTNEMEQCDKIAAATAKALERCGFDVMVAKSGTLMQTRCPESDKFGADIHMPIHTNASAYGNYTGGTRVFCLNSNGRKAAQAVCDTLGAISPGKDDAVIYKDDLYEINRPKALSVYVECEFHDTKIGSDWIRNNTNEIAEAICKGLCNYYGYTYVPAKSSSTAKPAQQSENSTQQTTAYATNPVQIVEDTEQFVPTEPTQATAPTEPETEPTQPVTEPTQTVPDITYQE